MHAIQTTFPPIKRYETLPPLKVWILLILDSPTARRSSFGGVSLTSLIIVEQFMYGKEGMGGKKASSKHGRFNLSAWMKIGQREKQTTVTWADGSNSSGED